MDRDQLTARALEAARGDPAAAAEFVRASQAEVWRLLAHLTDRTVADDLTQETYLRAFRSLPRFRGSSSARTWLLSIARRVAADHLRTRARRPREIDGADGADAETHTPTESDPAGEVSVRLLIGRLDHDRREAFVLTQMLGLSYQEAADVCACPIGTIRSRVGRARSDLVAALREEEQQDGFATKPGTEPPTGTTT